MDEEVYGNDGAERHATTVRDDVFAPTHLHCQCVDLCCTQHGAIFEWKLETLCVLPCKQTHPVKCSLDPQKGKNVMDRSGDSVERRTACERQAVTLQNFWLVCSQSTWVSNVANRSYPLICAKPATLEKSREEKLSNPRVPVTKLVVIKRGEALNPRVPVTYLGFEYRSVHDGDRRGFTVKPTAKYVDECLDIVQLQNAKAVMTPLTEQKSLNLHNETTVCDQVQHSLFSVGKLQYIT